MMFCFCCARILLASAYYKNIESRARLFKKITRSAVTLQLRDKGFSRQKEVSVESDEVLMWAKRLSYGSDEVLSSL